MLNRVSKTYFIPNVVCQRVLPLSRIVSGPYEDNDTVFDCLGCGICQIEGTPVIRLFSFILFNECRALRIPYLNAFELIHLI